MRFTRLLGVLALLILVQAGLSDVFAAGGGGGGEHGSSEITELPHSLAKYEATEREQGIEGLWNVLVHRVKEDPFNLVASLLFLLAIIHTFMAGFFRRLAHDFEEKHAQEMRRRGRTAQDKPYSNAKDDTSFLATAFHFLGEVEAIFGIWLIPLAIAITVRYDWASFASYIDYKVEYAEPIFVVIIMAIASTRPVLKFSEGFMGRLARLGGSTPAAWWLSILIVAPLLGSFITEPAAMTIAALMLGHQFYSLQPSPRFKYATLGLLFVNVSVGGTLTHFAAPPVLMVAGLWEWDMQFMFTHFGWKAAVGIVIATTIYYFIFRKEFVQLNEKAAKLKEEQGAIVLEEPVPWWVTAIVLVFMGFTVYNLHHPMIVIGGFLFFLAFVAATSTHQDEVRIKGPLLVGFFLAGLVTHGQFQQWWIAPVLSGLGEFPLFLGATVLTAFNDNAAITYLASQVPAFDWHIAGDVALPLEYAVVAGAVTGGGLTVIANAPNPAGQSLLQKYFDNGISPLNLLLGAIFPTIIMASIFMLLA